MKQVKPDIKGPTTGGVGLMEQIVWDDKFNIGVEVVDKAHSKLFRIMKKLLETPEDAEINQATFREGIKYLEAYTMTHFLEEETYMRSIRYGNYVHHKRIHDNFRDKTLVSIKADLERSDYSPAAVQRFALIINNWLADHIMVEDQAIVGRNFSRKNKGISSQIPLISKIVSRTTMEVFQIEAKLSNPEYKGQNIGNAFYCQRFYDIEGGLRVQILLGVGELLMMRGLNRVPGVRMTEKDKIDTETLLKIFKLLFQNVSKMFRVVTAHELDDGSLLTQDEFRTDFMKGYPCRLLFSTKAGSFMFCYRSFRPKETKSVS